MVSIYKANESRDTQKVRKREVNDKVWMYEEIMTNDDNLESNLLTSILLKMLVQVLLQVESDEVPDTK